MARARQARERPANILFIVAGGAWWGWSGQDTVAPRGRGCVGQVALRRTKTDEWRAGDSRSGVR